MTRKVMARFHLGTSPARIDANQPQERMFTCFPRHRGCPRLRLRKSCRSTGFRDMLLSCRKKLILH